MILLNKSCCGCTLRSGTQVIAWALIVLNALQMLLNLYLALMYGQLIDGWDDECPGGDVGPPGGGGGGGEGDGGGGGGDGGGGGGGRPPPKRPSIPKWQEEHDTGIDFEDIKPPTKFVGRRFPLAAKLRMAPYSLTTEVNSMLKSPVPRGLYFALVAFNAIGIILCVVLLVGLDMFDLGVMFVWLVAYGVVFIITFILYVVQLAGLYQYRIYTPAVFYTVGLFVGLVLTLYFMAIVFSYFEELRKEE